MNGNNLFETLQANIENYKNQHMIINSNEYISFKQVSDKKPKPAALEIHDFTLMLQKEKDIRVSIE